jgi:large subunit ribosomal protein L23
VEPRDILRRPIITEKNTLLSAERKYCFHVADGATKPMIKTAVESVFNVKVTAVNVVSVRGKLKRYGKQRKADMGMPWKKAIVTLKPGEQIELFEG